MQPASDDVPLDRRGDLRGGKVRAHGPEPDEPLRVSGQGVVQLLSCDAESIVRITLAGQRPVQGTHLVAQRIEAGGPLGVRTGPEEHGPVHPRLVQEPEVDVHRVVHMAVGVDDHGGPSPSRAAGMRPTTPTVAP
ncbi:hypothetical protein ACFYZ9_09915 [Streptomyces sp. NPDC001691]|uniref:hypothetical protein n=1 Tax=Streptomyces sp. NPDC001691 TaxID=3364600 RepID=UPI0036BF14AD